jgi:hypothetical protein
MVRNCSLFHYVRLFFKKVKAQTRSEIKEQTFTQKKAQTPSDLESVLRV